MSRNGLASRGVTLVEMLVALACTLILMGAVVQVLSMIGTSVAKSRTLLELNGDLRGARNMIQRDLSNTTCPTIPWTRPEAGQGYFEITEGSFTDRNPTGSFTPADLDNLNTPHTALGDWDDVLMFTARSDGAPFQGRLGTTIIESPVAEIVYFAFQDPTSRMRTLYRRVLLVTPWVNITSTANDRNFYAANDISSRLVTVGGVTRRIANTLGDLTKRENRFAHRSGFSNFPHALQPSNFSPLVSFGENTPRGGDDILLRSVLAFDVRVFDPRAPLRSRSVSTSTGSVNVVVEPGDVGWVGGTGITGGLGAFVDLGYDNSNLSVFSGLANSKSGLNFGNTGVRTYCTWSFHYEHDGLNQVNGSNSSSGAADEGTNGFDDGGTSGVIDDPLERETAPPYAAPLRGIRITLRVYEPSSRQIRQVSIVQNFVQ